jgi:hypothetical protein
MGSGNEQARLEMAALAARLIADGGLDYGQAKARAARELFGGRAPKGSQPDNDEVDEALREHLDLFDDDHAPRVQRLREAALELMDRLERFCPLVTGAAWKGIAAEHAPIHLQLFHDNPKEVAFFLLDARIPFDATTAPHFRGQGEVEAVELDWRGERVLLSLYDHDELRGAVRGGDQAQRGDRAALAARLQAAGGANAQRVGTA